MLLLNNMRMACDSTYLIDKETYISPKLHELKYILSDKLDIKNTGSKVIIFSEWVTMLQLIGKMLQESGIGFVRLTGQVAVKNRGKLIKKFERDPQCKVFLSTEAGGSGLNLQAADTVIHFELPWNPAKKNQRLGRIDRLGQKKKNLTVISLITKSSIETKIASGLNLKQNLFDGVMNAESGHDSVDFSAAGKAEFLRQLEESIGEFAGVGTDEVIDGDAANSGRDDEVLSGERFDRNEPEEKTIEDVVEEEESTGETAVTAGNGNTDQRAVMSEKERAEQMEEVLNKGMDFFSGLIRMTTGKDSGLENQRMEMDEKTGEVVMRFKIPKL